MLVATLTTNALRARLVCVPLFIFALRTHAGDWPQFLGPARNGACTGSDLANSWPKEGPSVVWRKKIGQGFSGPVVSSDKLILFHRLDDREVIECLNANDGKSLWTFDYPAAYHDDFGFDEGPRATPTIADGRVFALGAEGTLHCLEFQTGKKLWRVNTGKEFGAPKGFFGSACSPLVEGNAVLLNIGGANGAGIVALDGNTGGLVWKATDDEASYSSPVAATLNGRRYIFFFTRRGLIALNPATGSVFFEFPWQPRIHASVSAATPLIIGDLVFLSASYDTGAILLRVTNDRAEKVWSAGDVLSNHYATSVYHDGLLYGFDGRQEVGPNLRCVELKTGKVRWSEDRFGAGTITLVGDRLLVLKESGELIVAHASPGGFKPTAHAQILPNGVRAYPALAGGRLYARSKDLLVCVDLREPKKD
jgi:outer membrane protein assembly factor BamB